MPIELSHDELVRYLESKREFEVYLTIKQLRAHQVEATLVRNLKREANHIMLRYYRIISQDN